MRTLIVDTSTPIRSKPQPETARALAAVCSDHTGPDCQHCADAWASRIRRGFIADWQVLADIELERTNYPAWQATIADWEADRG